MPKLREPVFNSDGELLAVHHLGGQPAAVSRRQGPLKKNEGIRVACILEDFAQQGLALM